MIRNISDHKSELARPISEGRNTSEKPGFLLPTKQSPLDQRLMVQNAFSWFTIAHPEVPLEVATYSFKKLDGFSAPENQLTRLHSVLRIIVEAKQADLWLPPDLVQSFFTNTEIDQKLADLMLQFNQRAQSEVYFIVDKDNKRRSMLRKQKQTSFLTYTYFEASGDWVIGFDYKAKSHLSMVSPIDIEDDLPELRLMLGELGFRGNQILSIYDYTDGICFKNILKSNKQIDIFI